MDPDLQEMLGGDPDDEVAVVLRLRDPGAVVPGVRVVARMDPVATCRLRRGDIAAVRAHPAVASMKAPFGLVSDLVVDPADAEALDATPADQRRPRAHAGRGEGVIVAAIDWGLDVAHPDFRNPDGSTRLLALWDQRTPAGRVADNAYGYGVIHDRAGIDRALATDDPYGTLGYRPWDADPDGSGSHGTHVMGIAAGNGRAGGPEGVAPGADLVFVHLASPAQTGIENIGDSLALLEGVDFVSQVAGSRPWVLNVSMGQHAGPHDGSTLVEQGLDAVLTAAPGRAICMSAGNYFSRPIHTRGRVHQGESRTIAWETDPADTTPNELDIWYPGRDAFIVEIRSPDGSAQVRLKLGERAAILPGLGTAYHRARDPNNADHQVKLFLYPGGPGGTWQVTLTGADVVDGRYHAWVQRDKACRKCQSYVASRDAVRTTTLGSICNGYRTIAVGAFDARVPSRPLAAFSSAGPTRDGREKPFIVAPGVAVLAARSATAGAQSGAPLLARKSGTSMAAPHVAGCIALLFEAAGRPLPIQDTHQALRESADAVELEEADKARSGCGYLNVDAALEWVTRAVPPEPTRTGAAPLAAATEGEAEGEALERVEETMAETETDSAPETATRMPSLAEVAGELPVEATVDEWMSRLFSAAGIREPAPMLARLFDELATGRDSRWQRILDVVARPGAPVPGDLGPGTVLLRRGPGGFAHAAVLVDGRLLPGERAVGSGYSIEGGAPGFYAHVVEPGAFPHRADDRFARRLATSEGLLPRDQMVVRVPCSCGAASVEAVPRFRSDWVVPDALTESAPSARVCCILAPTLNPFTSDSNIADPSSLGTHGAASEATGLIYTGGAGFVDLGHLRDLVDLTKYIYDEIAKASGSVGVIATTHGEATVNASIDPAWWTRLARAIAYDDSYGYEILTYDIPTPGAHTSAFSPEDLPSNFLGTLVAERAITAGGSFPSRVTAELSSLLTSLAVQPRAETLRAFNLIGTRWVNYTGVTSLGAGDYLRRRNFDRVPWHAGHSSDAATPAFVTGGFGGADSFYSYRHTRGRSFDKTTFPAEVARIRADAKKRYGSDYDRP